MKRKLQMIVGAALALLLSLPTFASEVSADDAAYAVDAWVARGGTLGARLGAVMRVDAHTPANGAKFYAVKTAGGGTVFTSADTEAEPIMAFTSARDDFSKIDEKSPLWALLARAKGGKKTTTLKTAAKSAAKMVPSASATKWGKLIAEGKARVAAAANGLKGPAKAGIPTVGDVRVAPLLRTKWSQEGDVVGEPCCNYYTPNNYVCGCVATAMSQIMYKHRFPSASVTAIEKECFVSAQAANYTMKGGSYDWDSMPLEPEATVCTEVEREALGRLAYDAGVAVSMNWAEDGSGAVSCLVGEALRNVFGYGQAVFYEVPESGLSDGAVLQNAVCSNLDAGYPVTFGICYSDYWGRKSDRHDVVGDGYGYNGGMAYMHLNLGWAGQDDLWYAIPEIYGENAEFNCVEDITFNIFPHGTATTAAFSGRALLPNGKPAVGASVKIFRASDDALVANLVTGASGVWGTLVEGGIYNVDVELSGYGLVGAVSNVSVSAASTFSMSQEYGIDDYGYVVRSYTNSRCVTATQGQIGNSWGNDVTVFGAISGETLAWTETTALSATQFEDFNHAFAVTGGDAPYTWSVGTSSYTVSRGEGSTFDGTSGTPASLGPGKDGGGVSIMLPFVVSVRGKLCDQIVAGADNGRVRLGDVEVWIRSIWGDASQFCVATSDHAVTVRWGDLASLTLSDDGMVRVAYSESFAENNYPSYRPASQVSIVDYYTEEVLAEFVPVEADETNADVVFAPRGLPPGLALNGATGVLSGRPQVEGKASFTVTVLDVGGQVLSRDFTLTVSPSANAKPVITDCEPAATGHVDVENGEAVSFCVFATDDALSADKLVYTWEIDGVEVGSFTGSNGIRYLFELDPDDYNAPRQHTVVCYVSDGMWTRHVKQVWNVRIVKVSYVDASVEEDWEVMDGSEEHPWNQISYAVGSASAGDIVYVRPGTYQPFVSENCDIKVIATEGPSVTFVDAERNGPCYSCYGTYDEKLGMEIPGCKPWIEGFTLVNGFQNWGQAAGANGGTLVNCIIKDCSAARADEWSSACFGGAFGSKLVNCVIAGCSGEDAGAAFFCDLHNCTVVNNGSSNGTAGLGGSSAAYNTVFWGNDGADADEGAVLENCLTGQDPLLADPANGDYRLRAGSPCLDAGSNDWLVEGVAGDLAGAARVQNGTVDIGAFEGVGVSGFVIKVNKVGYGTVTASALAAEAGGSITFAFADRPLKRLVRNGTEDVTAQVVNDTYVWENITADGTLKAEFESRDFYVDATNGNDEWDGFSAETAKATLAAAVAEVMPDEVVYVKPGVYDPVVLADGQAARIVSTDGPGVTIIDGNGEQTCFRSTGAWDIALGTYVPYGELVGFTLRNGNGNKNNNNGGAEYARLENCVITNCIGRGAFECHLYSCKILGNTLATEYYDTDGAGAYEGIVSNCVVRGNRAFSTYTAHGGGVYNARVYDSIICDNIVETSNYSASYAQGGGTYHGYVYNSRVYDNLARCGYQDATLSNIVEPFEASGNSEEPPPEGGLPELPENPTAEDVETALEGVTFADDGVKGMITGAVDPVATYNEFKAWAGSVPGGEASVLESPRAAVSFAFGAADVFQNEPKTEITAAHVEPAEEGTGVAIVVTIQVKDGENAMAVASAKVAEMFEATSDLSDWNGEGKKLTPTVTDLTQGCGTSVSFKVKPGDGAAKSAFLRIRK